MSEGPPIPAGKRCAKTFAAMAICAYLLAPALSTPAAGTESGGVVVEKVWKGSEAEKAGLRAGDLLTNWSRESGEPSGGRLEDPFQFVEARREFGSRGPLVLSGRRGGEPLSVVLENPEWGVQIRPNWSGEELELYLRGRDAFEKDPGQGASILRELAALKEKEQSFSDWAKTSARERTVSG